MAFFSKFEVNFGANQKTNTCSKKKSKKNTICDYSRTATDVNKASSCNEPRNCELTAGFFELLAVTPVN